MDREKALKFIQDCFKKMVQYHASDMFFSADVPILIKIEGQLKPLDKQTITAAQIQTLARVLMNDKQAAVFEKYLEANFSITVPNIARFRVNVLKQKSHVSMVIRMLNIEIPSLEKLMLPPVLKEIALAKQGLVFIIGPAGSGKSTSIATMIDHRNQHLHDHIITIEDPIEFIHEYKNCLVNQREIGIDTESYSQALKNVLKQAPDVIFIGEIKDRETMEYALNFAKTGCLCLSTLYANTIEQAFKRILHFFPEDYHQQLLIDLSLNIHAFICQRLIPREEGKGLVAAVEILLNTPLISETMIKYDVSQLKEIMNRSTEAGMQTFDHAVFHLYEAHLISYENALRHADSVSDFKLKLKLESKRSIK